MPQVAKATSLGSNYFASPLYSAYPLIRARGDSDCVIGLPINRDGPPRDLVHDVAAHIGNVSHEPAQRQVEYLAKIAGHAGSVGPTIWPRPRWVCLCAKARPLKDLPSAWPQSGHAPGWRVQAAVRPSQPGHSGGSSWIAPCPFRQSQGLPGRVFFACGFNWSMQRLDSLGAEEDVADGRTKERSLHGR
jgi:hypothetical protein